MENPSGIIAGTIAMLLMAVFIVAFMVFYQQKQFRQKAEARKREEEYQLQLLEASLEVQEAERRRIAADLHDDIGTLLSATRLSLSQVSRSSKGSATDVQETKELLDEAIQNVRRISKELLPSALDNFGLVAAFDEFVSKIRKHTGIDVVFHHDTLSQERFDAKVELSLYRIGQELVNNSLKHSGATHIEIMLMHQQSRLVLSVNDNGGGFNLTDVQKPNSGLGLKNIESRLNVIGGTVFFDVAEGKGSHIVANVPLNA